ncbi:MAG: hypothetical protein HQK92_14440, partial [Nitrospirae bacterium]|nr:hypothetical protein [Nitrospirota bacterium]
MKESHFLRYGTSSEQKYMASYQHTYDGIAINGNMLAHISKSISLFVHKDIGKEFFIDPMTHSFQHETEKISSASGRIKSSIKKLIEIYGNPLKLILDEFRPITATDFNTNNIPKFVATVLGFQKDHIRRSLDEEYSDYIDYLEISKEPIFLIAPYFYMQSDRTFDDWFSLNSRMINESIKLKAEYKKDIFAELVIDKKLLCDEDKINKILKTYSDSKIDGLLYWINGFDETQATVDELSAVKDFVVKYKRSNPNKKIISLYGGYFSELLMGISNALDGVVHGLEYGESREVVPVGGGIPISKYY